MQKTILNDVWLSWADNVYAVGEALGMMSPAGRILHYDGSTWSVDYRTMGLLNGLWGSSPDDILAVDS